MYTLPIQLSFLNSLIINIAIIVGTTLTFYFVGLKLSTKRSRGNNTFLSIEILKNLTFPYQALVGIILGFISFILSLNKIPILSFTNSIDMRYVIVYFSVIYGTETIGLITSLSLILFKMVFYYFAVPELSFNEFFNNILFTLALLIIAIILKRTITSTSKKNILFLLSFIVIRLLTFPIYFYPFFQPRKLLEFAAYVMLFSVIFLLTTWLIDIAISISQSVHIYRTAAIFDGLTKVYNRESFHFFLDYVANLPAMKDHSFLSLSIIDIDNFKKINDTYGHPIGDEALAYLAKVLVLYNIEGKDFVCRIGGDEFAIVHGQPKEEVEKSLNNIRQHLLSHPFQHEGKSIPIELSIGLSHFVDLDESFNVEKALDETDKLLYEAKKRGKNQTISTLTKKG